MEIQRGVRLPGSVIRGSVRRRRLRCTTRAGTGADSYSGDTYISFARDAGDEDDGECDRYLRCRGCRTRREEVREVALALHADPTKDVFLGVAANERQVRTMKLDDRRVIMFATHGLVPGDLDGLAQPALALSAPSVADVDGDGLLTMDKILGLKLDADWVVLSACNTAAGDGAGAEAVSGLGRAFFYAGARALLVMNWPVETTSARVLTTTVFQRQSADTSLSRAEALRASMLTLLDGPGYVDVASGKVSSIPTPILSSGHRSAWWVMDGELLSEWKGLPLLGSASECQD